MGLSWSLGPLGSYEKGKIRFSCREAPGLEQTRLWLGTGKDAQTLKDVSMLPNGLPWWLRPSRIHLQCSRPGFDPWVGKIPWRREWQPTPVFLPRKILGTGKPGGLQSVGLQRVDRTQQLTHTHALQQRVSRSMQRELELNHP